MLMLTPIYSIKIILKYTKVLTGQMILGLAQGC